MTWTSGGMRGVFFVGRRRRRCRTQLKAIALYLSRRRMCGVTDYSMWAAGWLRAWSDFEPRDGMAFMFYGTSGTSRSRKRDGAALAFKLRNVSGPSDAVHLEPIEREKPIERETSNTTRGIQRGVFSSEAIQLRCRTVPARSTVEPGQNSSPCLVSTSP